MKHIKKIFLFCLFSIVVHAQTGIGTASPDSSAKLEVASNNKGILIPRMTSSQITAITNPANGLLVYQTDGVTGFYVNSGSSGTPNWTRVNSDWVKSGNDISYSGGNVLISGIKPQRVLLLLLHLSVTEVNCQTYLQRLMVVGFWLRDLIM